MIKTHAAALRMAVVALVCAMTALLGAGHAPVSADVVAVTGSAYGYSASSITLFGGAQPPVGPVPTVTLPPGGSAAPITATLTTGLVSYGPATLFSSGIVAVSTQGTTGPTGSVTSSTNVATVNSGGTELLTASNVASTCTASGTGVTGSTTITGGSLQIDTGDDTHLPVTVPLPANPAPGTSYDVHIHLGSSIDYSRYVFNEQVVNADGSLTVNAVHERFIGPTLTGDLIIGRSVCGITGTVVTPDTTPPTVTPPTADFRRGVAIGTSATPVSIKIRSSAADASGITATRLQHRIGAGIWTNVPLPTLTSIAANVSVTPSTTTSHRFRAKATDGATPANTSTYATAPGFRVKALQDGATSIVQTGTWSTQTLNSFYGGTARFASGAGRTQSVTAVMTDVAIVTTRGPGRGIATVFVDGVLKATLDLYSATTAYRQVPWTRSFPGAATTHTIELRVTGTRNAASSAARVDLDAFLLMTP